MNTKDFIDDLKADITKKLKSPRYLTAKFLQGDMGLDAIRTELSNIAQELGIELKGVGVDYSGFEPWVIVTFVQHNDDEDGAK